MNGAMKARRTLGYTALGTCTLLLMTSPATVFTNVYTLDVGRMALYLAILAATWSLLAGVNGQFSFAHVTIPGMAAYAGAIVVRAQNIRLDSLDAVVVAVLIATIIAAISGLILGLLLRK